MATAATKERPILFSGEMVRAILDGRKTQTRRVVKDQDSGVLKIRLGVNGVCPFGSVDDRLWVRETWAVGKMMDHKRLSGTSRKVRSIHYLADGPKPDWAGRTRVSIHMPRWASRITLEITGVRVERLNDISQPDIAAEGIDCHPTGNMRTQTEYVNKFKTLWESINGEGSWALNPWVWVIEFRKVN